VSLVKFTCGRGRLMMQRVARFLVLSALGVIVAALFSAGGSADTVLSCGDVVQADTVLANDITGCAGAGLIVSGDGVKLDLGGHRISGAASNAATGLTVLGAGVVVSNGSIDGFGLGAFLKGSQPTLMHVEVSRNGTGIDLHPNSDGFRLLSNSVSHNRNLGVLNEGGASGGFVAANKVVGNGGSGLVAPTGADGVRYENNRFSDNGEYGLRISDATSKVIGNVANGNGASGIFVYEGFQGFSDSYLIADNSADRNGNFGIEVSKNIYGESPTDGGGNTAKHNGNPLECLNIVCG